MVLAVVALMLIPVSAMAGMTAFMNMDELSNTEMAQTTGQTGLTINATASIAAGSYIAWGDDDGCAGIMATATTQGWLQINDLLVSGLILDGTTVDVCTEGTLTTWLVIGVPEMTVFATTTIELGSGPQTTLNTLGLVQANLHMTGMTLMITGH
jgi:hypothetical protein